MKLKAPWNYVPPPGAVLSFALIGLVLLSSLLYYRAVRIQRFLEPALALSQPRNEFSEAIARIVEQEFGKGPIRGLDVRTSSLVIEQALLVSRDGSLHDAGRSIVKRLSRVFLKLLEGKQTRADISLVLISAGYPPGVPGAEASERARVQRMLGGVLDALLAEQPGLKANYWAFFATTARPALPRDGYRELMEFRIIPSEMLHMEVLQRLQKYVQ